MDVEVDVLVVVAVLVLVEVDVVVAAVVVTTIWHIRSVLDVAGFTSISLPLQVV